ncbi:mucin-5AC [Leguminivora glycinivorella]|uniref:mucin-5AC n=1 Tax=Leguminivora glycinivorella TaxID=1035111 RepID=UPI00200ECE5C|nr:mucin-5AC [Leguminivora glycinivorella]XP_047996624.1 mucin-5AC [Leguminivora glycinivorella]
MAPSVLASVLLLLASSSAREQSRWSRQISSYTADISDWVPLSAPAEQPSAELKRQAVAEPRILSEPFPPFARPAAAFNQDFRSPPLYQNRPLYLQSVPSVPSAPQNFLTDQGFGQSIRFGLSQPNFPLNQGFISPQFNYDTVPQIKPRPTVPANPVKFESFPKPLPSPQAKPFLSQAPKKLPLPQGPKFVDGYRLENASNDFVFNQKKPQSLQKLKFEGPKTETVIPNKSKLEREEVQLLYVPVESLNQGQFNFRNPQIQYSTQGLPKQNPLKQPFVNDFQRPAKPAEHVNFGQEYYNYNPKLQEFDQVPKFSTIPTPFPTAPPTTPRPKKLKPHQPPLAVFLSREAKKGSQVKVGDVLSSLKNANTIAVLDAVNPLNAPKVFIGPSTLTPPENFVKFELPYLSNIENSANKLRQLPFFVAPLSYHTPEGFAKIPFPSPHVGSVVINSQIKDSSSATSTTPEADVIPNSYVASPPSQRQNSVTQKPNFSYYSTVAPKTNAPAHQSEYYSFEPQTVTSIRPSKEPADSIITAPPKTGSYFLSNEGQQYSPNQYAEYSQENYSQEQVRPNIVRQPKPTTPTTTRPPKTTSRPSSTYSSQLLETHNPYSINQAFHFSTPLDYNHYLDEKDNYSTQPQQQFKPLPSSSASPAPTTPSTTLKPEVVTEKQSYQSTQSNYAQQNYSPEIHYESEIQNSRFPVYNSNEFTTKTEYNRPETVNTNNLATVNSPPADTDNRYVETQAPVQENYAVVNEIPATAADAGVQPTNPSYNQYYTSFVSNESQESSTTSTSTTTTTTTRRPPIRTRGRPRYTTTPRTNSNESTTKYTATRRPLRERRPLPTRSRYEPNKITTEKPTRKPVDSNESSTKSSPYSSRTRTRGRVQFKPSDSDEGQYNRNKGSSKEEDLAYQRDVLHQNYPVTLMERGSTVDVEAITEPAPKFQSTKNVESSATYDTENAYTYERASVSQPIANSASSEHTFPSRSEGRTETPYVPHVPSTREEYVYHSRSSSAPVDAISYDESSPDDEDTYAKQTTPIQKDASPEVSYATEAVSPVTEQAPSYSVTIRQETATPEYDNAKFLSEEVNHEEEVQTTPSYNRVRVRPGLIKQYHQASTESTKTKERKNPVQAITYRPAFDRRRTTMRIEEIGEDLKTKQVFARPEVQEHRHPVYKPEPTTEPPATAAQEPATKRGQFRRRRPSYTTTSTEATSSKKTYEVKNRFRGRRPTTEKPTEKTEAQTEASTTTIRNTLHSRYSNRPRLSERYNKKQEAEDQDQEPNYSINRPKFAEPETVEWSADSFKPYNPNDIIDDRKDSTAGLRSDDDGELDIITARNEYDDILISVTPATNRLNKKIPDIPPTLEALVEQSKVTKSDSPDAMSTFESMLEEVMKSLEEQDEDEYSSSVMKHKGGEIGEIPPERIISSGDNAKPSTPEETTATDPTEESSILSEEDKDRKSRRRGFWKKVAVRPATTEAIEAAESQHYAAAVNRLAPPAGKAAHDKLAPAKVTTYKPTFDIKDIFTDDSVDELPTVDIPKINAPEPTPLATTENILQKETPTEMSPGDLDLGTGSPDPTVAEPTTTEASTEANIDRNDGFSFMDYLFGTTADENDKKVTKATEIEVTMEPAKIRITTTESNVIPEEITAVAESEDTVEAVTEFTEIKKSNATEAATEAQRDATEAAVESTSVSGFMDPAAVVSTSMSTEVSHETEICFRGKCIKTSKDLL